jgi:hypothetical protein
MILKENDFKVIGRNFGVEVFSPASAENPIFEPNAQK